jgi:peptidyl-prolyl cis-trans isomerase C
MGLDPAIMVAPSAWASHILVASKSEAVQLREKVGKLKDFQKLARKKSTCPSSQKGGDLGWFRKGQMVRPFEEAVWNNELASVSEPVKTQFGYHLIWVHERDEA